MLARERVQRVACRRLVRQQRALGCNRVDLVGLLRELLWRPATGEHDDHEGEQQAHAQVFTADPET